MAACLLLVEGGRREEENNEISWFCLSLMLLFPQVEELRARLDEKNRLIENKTQNALQAVQERNRMSNEITELKDHMDIKDRKINVLQRKVNIKNKRRRRRRTFRTKRTN